MKIVVFGAAGQVGTDCVAALTALSMDVVALTRADVDFADERAVALAVIDSKPDVVVNACAYTAVDKAESEEEIAHQVNGRSVAALAAACEQAGAALIHLSTDYVFNGDAQSPYTEVCEVNPLGVYGVSKYLGEQGIANAMQRFIVLRTSWVFGESGNNFVKTMLRLGAERSTLSVVSDQWGRPTYVGHIVDVIVQLIDHMHDKGELPWGVYHCSSQGESNWFEFAQAIFSVASARGHLAQPPVVNPITSSAYPTPAPRPKYSVLSTEKLEALLGKKMPSWQDGLQRFFDV